jgi:hypothetical protein
MITTDRHTASKTLVPTQAQVLGYGSAARTPLAGAVGVYLDQPSTSFFRFVRQFGQETTPTDIIDGLGQCSPGQAFDIQIFHCNQIIVGDQYPGGLVMKIRPLVADVSVDPLKCLNCLASPAASLLSTGYLTLSPPEAGLGLPVVAGVLNYCAVAQSDEALQSNVNPSDFSGGRQWLRDFKFNTKTDIPASTLPLEGHGFYLTHHRAVEFDFQDSDPLDVEVSIISELAPITVGREGVAVEASHRLEPGETGLPATLNPSEERLESLVHPAQHVLASGVILQPQVPHRPNRFKLVGLVIVG